MSTSRSGFLKGLNKLGFSEKSVNTQMNRYFPREFFEKGDHVVAMSTKNNEVEVTLYHTKAKTILRFDNYKDALKSIVDEEDRIQNRLSTLLDDVEIDSERILSFIEEQTNEMRNMINNASNNKKCKLTIEELIA